MRPEIADQQVQAWLLIRGPWLASLSGEQEQRSKQAAPQLGTYLHLAHLLSRPIGLCKKAGMGTGGPAERDWKPLTKKGYCALPAH